MADILQVNEKVCSFSLFCSDPWATDGTSVDWCLYTAALCAKEATPRRARRASDRRCVTFGDLTF